MLTLYRSLESWILLRDKVMGYLLDLVRFDEQILTDIPARKVGVAIKASILSYSVYLLSGNPNVLFIA